MKIDLIFLIAALLCLTSCSKDENNDPPDTDDPSVSVYADPICTAFRDIFWIDNETILVFDNCGKIKEINVVTKRIVEINDFRDYELLPQTNYYFNNIPGYCFYTAATPSPGGGYGDPINLYRFNLTTKENLLVTDSLPNPLWETYITGSHHLAIPQPMNDTIMILDLQNLTTDIVELNGSIKCFSPDDKKAVFYLYDSQKFSIYDFSSNSFESATFYGAGMPLWRGNEIFAASLIMVNQFYSITPYNLYLQNMTSGEVLCTMEKAMEWGISQGGVLVAAFTGNPDYETSLKASLVTFNLLTKVKSILLTVEYNWLFNRGYIGNIAVSPDQKKVVFSYNFSELKMVETY